MKSKILVICLSLAVALQAYSQEDPFRLFQFYDGYIVHHDGTTERGFIQYLDETDRYEKVVFQKDKDGKKQKYKVVDLDGYMVAETRYKALEFDDIIGKTRKFVVITDEGCINSYFYRVLGDDGVWSGMTIFETDKMTVNSQKFALSFSKKMAELLADDPELAARVANKEKEYGMLKMYDIVAEYNERCKKR